MAETIPSRLMITDVTITNHHRTYSTTSMTGVKLARDSGIQWFKGSITLQAYGYPDVRLLNGFLSNLKGRLNPFILPLKGAFVNPDIGSNPTFSSNQTRGISSIPVNHVGSLIGMGSVFNVPNDPKLYTLSEDISGIGTFKVTPALKSDASETSPCNFMTPVISAILDGNETTITHEGNGLFATATLSWSEALI